MARVLIAEAEDALRLLLADALKLEGHEIHEAADGRAALRLLERHSFHVLITDLRMSGVDGVALVQKARRERPETEVVVLAASGSTERALEAMQLGAFDYLQKPIHKPEEVRIVVHRAAERQELLALRERTATEEEERDVSLSYGDPAMAPVEEAIRRVARTNSPVLLLGERGTGKEVAARKIHRLSNRTAGPFVAVNCAAVPVPLLESALFGQEKGAFTSATARRRGRVELADGGTLFLDEVGGIELPLQETLLRVIREGRFTRVRGRLTVESDVRWIAATDRPLEPLIEAGRFREDLFRCLTAFLISLPPLRERRADIPPLAETLSRRIAQQLGCVPPALDAHTRRVLLDAEWRGNVRALANTLERALIRSDGRAIRAADLGLEASAPQSAAPIRTLTEIERETILMAIGQVGGDRRRAAQQLGIDVRTLYGKLKRYGMG